MHYANVENINVLYEMREKKSQLRSRQPGQLGSCVDGTYAVDRVCTMSPSRDLCV